MITTKNTDNEYADMPPEQAVDIVSEMLDRHAEDTDRALALAIVLRDRIESREGDQGVSTDAVLAGMLVEQLCGSPEHSIKQCLNALLEKCRHGGAK